MRKMFFWLAVIVVLVALVVHFGYKPITQLIGLTPPAGIHVESDVPSIVYINGTKVGITTFEDKTLTSGDYTIEVKPDISEASVSAVIASASADVSWKRKVHLNEGTLTVIHREFIDSPPTSSGEVITLNKGKGVTIITNPSQSEVSINDQKKGTTPLHLNNITSGEVQFLISKDNYLKRSIQAMLIDGFNLTINVDLSPMNINSPSPTPTPVQSATPKPNSSTSSVSPSPSSAATFKVVVNGTPNGFLRVRKSPSTSSDEVTRVNDGDVLTVMDETNGWYQVKLSDGKEGYASSVYTSKQ